MNFIKNTFSEILARLEGYKSFDEQCRELESFFEMETLNNILESNKIDLQPISTETPF